MWPSIGGRAQICDIPPRIRWADQQRPRNGSSPALVVPHSVRFVAVGLHGQRIEFCGFPMFGPFRNMYHESYSSCHSMIQLEAMDVLAAADGRR